MKNILKDNSGQTLIELLTAIGIISIGLFSVWNLFLSNFSGEQSARDRVVGSNLAREGMEVVRNIRDTNWLKVDVNDSACGLASDELCQWDDGLTGGNTAVIGNIVVKSDLNLIYKNGEALIASIDDPMAKIYLNADGFFNNDATGSSTPFSRIIKLQNICCLDATADLKCDNTNFVTSTVSGCPVDWLKIGMDVECIVAWNISGRTESIKAQDQLFNWR
ncbi:MAG: prepilin-type N-terminal cleavage/methylation domain-containing protein [bacterium]